MKLPRLREVRELRGWSQGVLAEKADVSRDSISNYETGHREAYPATAKKLADTLGVEIADLVARAEEPGPKVVTGSARIPLPPEQFAVLAALAEEEISIEEAAERLARIRASELATV